VIIRCRPYSKRDLRRGRSPFEVEQELLALEAACVPSEHAVLADDAMAADDDRQWVAPDSLADPPRQGPVSQRLAEISVGRGLAEPEFAQ
jgi:hypothetical protein